MRGLDDPIGAGTVTPRDLITRAEAQRRHRIRCWWRRLVGRPLRRYPAAPSWTPHIVAGCLGLAAAAAVAAFLYLAR